ncbi:DUF1648 domain-containing protein [Streptomyces sp. MAR4 CNX-425]|uniref:DUF1648 domain-containing protein n=1 Tax=Streptomyces sp. MAR4 CNX-425 TaxID=3406343 RepID=UPI003B50C978
MGDANRGLLPWLAGLPCLVGGAVVGVVCAASWSRLPDPVAVQFGADGQADSFASPGQLLTLCILLFLCEWLAFTHVAVRGTVALRSVVTCASTLTAFLGYAFVVLIRANAGAGDAREARMPLWHLAVAAALAAVAWAGTRVLPLQGVRGGPGRAESVGLRAGERAVWMRVVGPRWLVAAGLLGTVALLVAGMLGWTGGFWLSPAGVVVAAIAGMRVSIDPRGLAIKSPWLGLSWKRVPMERIERVWVDQVWPLPDLGGWGYRIVEGRHGLALRSGEGVWLELTGGEQFVVVVDDAESAVGLLGDLIARRPGTDG